VPNGFFSTVVGTDPQFVNGGAQDFRLTPDSSARNIGASIQSARH